MSLKAIGKLGGLRLVALVLMLGQNVLLVRFMTLEDIGRYYLMVTVSYLGNAAIFVGSDLYLQRKLSHLSVRQELNQAALVRYISFSAIIGGAIVLIAAGFYFSIANKQDYWLPTLVCAMLSIAAYLSALGRNLCQLAGHPVFSNLGPITEGTFRSIAICTLAYIAQANAISVTLASAIGSLFSAAVTLGLLLHIIENKNGKTKSYVENASALSGTVITIGSSGLLNWIQLQGYRPLMMNLFNAPQIIGSVAFMSSLGSTAANAAFTILAQIQVPRQYSTNGGTTLRYLLLLGSSSIFLTIASLPAGAFFLWLSGKTELIGLIYLVATGVILEAGNAAIGICTHHMNVLGQKMWQLPFASLLGCMVTTGLIMAPFISDLHARLASALISGQFLAVIIILYFTYRATKNRDA